MLVFGHFDFSFLPLKTNLVGPKAKTHLPYSGGGLENPG